MKRILRVGPLFGVAILLLLLFFPDTGRACTEYAHLWSTASETTLDETDPASARLLIEELERRLCVIATGTWGITLTDKQNSTEEMQPSGSSETVRTGEETLHEAAFTFAVGSDAKDLYDASSASSTASNTSNADVLNAPGANASNTSISWRWRPPIPMFSGNWQAALASETELAGMVWVDVVSAHFTRYFWIDRGSTNAVMFRCGILAKSLFRVVAVDRRGEVRLIEEFDIPVSLDWDGILPIPSVVGGLWIRRVGRNRPPIAQSREFMIGLPPVERESTNTLASGTERYYLGLKGPLRPREP